MAAATALVRAANKDELRAVSEQQEVAARVVDSGWAALRTTLKSSALNGDAARMRHRLRGRGLEDQQAEEAAVLRSQAGSGWDQLQQVLMTTVKSEACERGENQRSASEVIGRG